jgi:hypothetical protein
MLDPLVKIRSGFFVNLVWKTSALTICPTAQFTAAAASFAVRVLLGSSWTLTGMPSLSKASLTRWVLDVVLELINLLFGIIEGEKDLDRKSSQKGSSISLFPSLVFCA